LPTRDASADPVDKPTIAPIARSTRAACRQARKNGIAVMQPCAAAAWIYTDTMNSATHSLFSRAEWAGLRPKVSPSVTEAELARLRGAGEPMPMAEVEEIYLPLARLINMHFQSTRRMMRVTDDFLGRPAARLPYVIAIAGSVAVGKSTVARLIRRLLARWPEHPEVMLVTTDGFLYPRNQLLSSGLMKRKGFPESYDVKRMIQFLIDIRTTGHALCPVYSHESYDILPDQTTAVDRPDILIFEGLNVLQIGTGARHDTAPTFTASDFFDFTIYIDADQRDIEQWYLDRFMLLKGSAFKNPTSYFHHLAEAPDDEVEAFARKLWKEINLPNLVENILPTRSRAGVVIEKNAQHMTSRLWLRQF
jgi:type I pantothenate kinase